LRFFATNLRESFNAVITFAPSILKTISPVRIAGVSVGLYFHTPLPRM